MSIDKYNAEHYIDDTAYQALTNIENEKRALYKYRPFVYICSPFSGDVRKNIISARKYSRFAVNSGYIPITPHLLYPQFLDDMDPIERKLGLHFGNILMDKCKEVWVFGLRISTGMHDEIKRAERKKYKLRYFTEECMEVNDGDRHIGQKHSV